MKEVEGGGVEGAVKPQTEVVRYAVYADVENGNYRRAGVQCLWEEWGDLATEADG